ncbi:MAG: hypothetical protein D4R64_09940 [Porphyromonadaceae bacterium]|nr:MAG: hypothetical protein D4R64_09940 [Porphyromonadaceae bacterium]
MADNLLDKANEILDKAQLAAAEFHQFNQEQTDRIVEAVFKTGFNNRVKLAKMAQEEIGMGVWEHKVIKNVLGIQLVYESIRNEKTVWVISTSTVMFKILICLKSRNPIIISSHRGAATSCTEAVRICYESVCCWPTGFSHCSESRDYSS